MPAYSFYSKQDTFFYLKILHIILHLYTLLITSNGDAIQFWAQLIKEMWIVGATHKRNVEL